MVFEFKNIHTETLSEYLLMAREEKKMSLELAGELSTVPIKYIKALEIGDFSKLPASVYVFGFLKKLAILYGVPQDALLDQFRKETAIATFSPNARSVEKEKFKRFNIAITPRLISVVLGTVLVIITLGWLVWQVLGINTSPELTIFEPRQGEVIKESVVKIKGKTDTGSNLSINKENVFVDKDGNFTATLSILSGQTDLVFESTNKFSKKATKTVSIVVDLPANTSTPTNIDALDTLILEITVNRDLPISLTVDGAIVPTEIIKTDVIKKVSARTSISLLTPDAGNTLVSLNGKDLGVLGRAGQTLTVPFSKQSLDGILRNP